MADTLVPPKPLGQDNNRDSIATSAASSYKAPISGSPSHTSLPVLPSAEGRPRKKRKAVWAAVALAALAVIVVAVVVPVYFKVVKKDSSTASSASSSGSSTTSAASPEPTSGNPTNNVITTGDGSTVTKDDGTTFTYTNKFGGYWVFDPANPFNNSARAQSWSPPLNEPWRYGVDQIRGVNLGGWLVLEPFIAPALYEPYQPQAVDEWTLSEAIAANASSGLQKVLEEHYATFITEEDFAQIAAAGLNWVRVPLPFWAVSKLPEEPFLERVSWKYFLKAIEWCRKYGLRMQLDLHAIPGSQNAFDHSGKRGNINFLRGNMGLANAQRALNVIRSITEFISRDEYKDIVQMFGVMNEPASQAIGMDSLTSFYVEMHDMMRTLTGAGKGPWISLHDGFDFAAHTAAGFMPVPIALLSLPIYPAPVTQWSNRFNSSLDRGIFVSAGEFLLDSMIARTYFLNGASSGYRYDGTLPTYNGPRIGSCAPWLDSSEWTDETKELEAACSFEYGLHAELVLLDLENRSALNVGTCPPIRAPLLDPAETPTLALRPLLLLILKTVSPAAYRAAHPFPPTNIVDSTNLAVYPETGTPVILPGPEFKGFNVPTTQSGTWEHDYQPVAGCTYPDPWNSVGAAVPACAAAGGRKRFVKEPRH
ncbi:Cellulase (glycosyl hydrolase family 5 protein) [Rhizoctonia solani]|uniref:glucan 1,3-beta-glucosidase n=1 Tax=Rhizoctonia solani TaxID=456999 RepID=A0A8H8NMU0_9AGAM|nr:Cellulase (glycosyl hydrolase family 5 protein) [Rhizoctonia solani]QRW16681.1 Cellulase (glycosyl hydrolase family 5 protein) [Rhizoctonia solani]